MYATAEEYRNQLKMTEDEGRDSEIEQDLTAISKHIDKRTGRFFTKDAEPVTRIYEAAQGRKIYVDDIAEAPTEIVINFGGISDLTLEPGDYDLWPYNADKGPEPRPWIRIDLSRRGSLPLFHLGDMVSVTAKFGWPEVPEAIKIATIQITALLRLETPRATRRIPELGDAIETSMDAQRLIKQLVDPYKREGIG